MLHRPVFLVFLCSLTLLSACRMGSFIHQDPNAVRVEIGRDVFHVLIESDRAIVNNFATGFDNQLRLHEGARQAILTQTSCEITEMIKLGDMNFWQARLAC